MIYGVWIIYSNGICLFYREYENLNVNEQLFSGFVIAILSFSKQISNRQLKSINLEDFTLYYENIEDNNLSFVVAADTIDSESKIREKITLIEKSFLNKFRTILPEWNGDMTIFRDFDPILDNILKSRGTQIHLFDFNFYSENSFKNALKKFSFLCNKRDEKGIVVLSHTIGILEDITRKCNSFTLPKFLIEAPHRMRDVLKRSFKKDKK
ncbi:MAG: hypothetical protein ACFFD2_01300 [Promethearchaeota archaeon]